MPPVHLAPLIQALEDRALISWPALKSQTIQNWTLRISQGYSKRSNSITPLHPSPLSSPEDHEELIDAAERAYKAEGLPCIFRITPFASPGSDEKLLLKGYRRVDECLVMLTSLKPPHDTKPQPVLGVEYTSKPSISWLNAFTKFSNLSGDHHLIHARLVESIPHITAFTALSHDSQPVALAYAALSKERIGIFDVVVSPDHRGKGYGRAVMRACMDWGASQGAREAYLQVGERNTVGRGLYESLGFREIYKYHYMVKDV
jgi:GNAT superfamily N-acetyltransferase